MIQSRDPGAGAFERRLGRLLIGVTIAAVALITAGVLVLLASGVSPLAGGPGLDPGGLVAGILALEPGSLLWAGILAVIATPLSRVVGAAVGFVGRGEPLMAAISLAILGVIGLSVLAALGTG